ncbi:unnamed protein product [Dovyalis caffra]|uniref:Uncharacterized protein n=1 Tax=Dovyalis caffra TaxID=77055 RepID=A0AAV1RPN9_9ROSI|nr:unnamed protein product [Dovyalis caffra]
MAKKKNKSSTNTSKATLRRDFDDPVIALKAPSTPISPLAGLEVEDCSDKDDYLKEEVDYSNLDGERISRSKFFKTPPHLLAGDADVYVQNPICKLLTLDKLDPDWITLFTIVESYDWVIVQVHKGIPKLAGPWAPLA